MGQITRTQFGCTKTVTLTNAQIIAASVAPIELVPAVAGKILIPVFGLARFDWVADMGSVDPFGFMQIGCAQAVSDSQYLLVGNPGSLGVIVAAGASAFGVIPEVNGFFDDPEATLGYASQSLQFFIDNNGAPLTGGAAGNHLTIEAHYLVI